MSTSIADKIKKTVDLQRGVDLHQLGRFFGSDETLGHEFIITILDGGEPVDLTGATIAGYFFKPDGLVEPILGEENTSVDGNTVTVRLTAPCYTATGRFTFTIRANHNGVIHTIYYATGTVTKSYTDEANTSGVVKTLDEINAEILALQDKVDAVAASIPAEYSDMVSHVAEMFSESKAYTTGQYVWNGSKLYQFNADHAAGEWIGTDADETNLADSVVDLDSKTDSMSNMLYSHYTELSQIGVRKGFAISTAGRYSTNSTIAVSGYGGELTPTIQAGDTITIAEGYLFRYAIWTVPVYGNTNTDYKIFHSPEIAGPATVTVSKTGYLIFSIWYSDKRTIPNDLTAEEIADAATDCYVLAGPRLDQIANKIADIEKEHLKQRVYSAHTTVFEAQKAIADDWHFPLINISNELGLGSKHQIPGTAKTWNTSGTTDLTQRGTWMSDAIHPFRGEGLVDMFGRAIANQLALISPSYHDGPGETSPSYWAGKRLLWMGTSIPAGSDPDAGSGTGATYPSLVATQLGATAINIARGSSMLRIASSTGGYHGVSLGHFLRSLTRMNAEATVLADNWDDIKAAFGSSAPSSLYNYYPDGKGGVEDFTYVDVMQRNSFETLLKPYLDGTNPAPDLYVIDHGHNDTANGIDGERDFWIAPTAENIAAGILAEDSYMTANDYANLKLALNNDLSGITDLPSFAASLNRNCFQGACNFLITLILRYKPYARIVLISNYD